MPNPFTNKIWTANALYMVPDRLGGTDTVEWDDDGPFLAATLLRTIVTAHFYGYGLYSIGPEGIPNAALGFGLGETSSSNYNGNPPEDDPAADYVDYIATGSSALQWTALGWSPDDTGHLSGSINEIDSDGTLAMTNNINTYMYGTATILVDSKAQRRFGGTPHFKLTMWEFNGPYLLSMDRWASFHVRTLWEQNA